MKRLTPNQIEARDARDLLQNEITKTCALLEVMAVLRRPIKDEFIALNTVTIDGLYELAMEQSDHLQMRFEDMCLTFRREIK